MTPSTDHNRHTTGDGSVVGIVLAAGEGRRFGRPKALVRGANGETWLERSVQALLDGGVRTAYVVLGADRAVSLAERGWL